MSTPMPEKIRKDRSASLSRFPLGRRIANAMINASHDNSRTAVALMITSSHAWPVIASSPLPALKRERNVHFDTVMSAGDPSIYHPRADKPMHDLDEFAEVTLTIFVALTLLIWLLTYLERTLVRP